MKEPGAVFVPGTWFKENSCPNFRNYTLYREDGLALAEAKKLISGGGVCIYITNSIQYDSYSLDDSDFGFPDPSIETVRCCCLVNK